MSLVTERERRQTAGNRLKRLLEQQDQDDEFYETAYGGFHDEAEDNDYHSEESEDDEVDSDFDQDDNEQQNDDDNTNKEKDDEDGNVDEGEEKRRKKVVYQAQSLQQEIKAKKKAEQDSGDAKITRQTQKKALPPTIEAKTLRTSTSVKRVELEKRQKERQERRNYMKGVASLRNTGEVRRLTQEELLEEAKITEEINLASLEAYQKIETKKKEIKRMKLIQECPRICSSSITMNCETKTNDNEQWNDMLDSAIQLGPSVERCSRNFVSFTHVQTFHETFPKQNSVQQRSLRRRRLCPITNLPAQYFDPLTQMPYANFEAFQILRRIYAEELKKQKRTPSVLIDAQRDVNLNVLR